MPFSASLVELASTGGFNANMRATRPERGLLRPLLVSAFVYLLCSTCAGAMADRKLSSLRRSRARLQRTAAHHQPLTDEQKADQNLQFMMSLYQSAAEPDGRPKQHRKFGSNTVRLLKPSASSVIYLPASTGELNRRSRTLMVELNWVPRLESLQLRWLVVVCQQFLE